MQLIPHVNLVQSLEIEAMTVHPSVRVHGVARDSFSCLPAIYMYRRM